MESLHIIIDNIHCDNCRDAIRNIISEFYQLVPSRSELTAKKVIVQFDARSVDITSTDKFLLQTQNKVIKSLEQAGFDVVDFYTDLEHQHNEIAAGFLSQVPIIGSWIQKHDEKEKKKQHLENCESCRAEKESVEVPEVVTVNTKYRAVFTITGMTCSACVNAITESVAQLLPEDASFTVDLINHTAVGILPNKQVANSIVSHVKELGYSAQLVEILPVQTETRYKMTAAIGGITCAACANAITEAVSEMVEDVAINVVSKTGVFVINDPGQQDLLVETIEDCGFDVTVTDMCKIDHASSKSISRTVLLKVDGMFCKSCPERVNNVLSEFGSAVVIDDPITLENPFVKFTYIPSSTVKIRGIMEQLSALGEFKVEIIESVSLEEHLKRISRAETMAIAKRLVAVTIIAIPTFVFSVVGMSLVPKGSAFRTWIDEPIWAGNVSRVIWILLFLSTPVYFFVADIFHRKAFAEVRSLWKYKNTWRKRLFRFGSMNLLMCLGTSIAYFASIAMLILGAKSEKLSMGYTTTYFDSVVFLTFFLMIGRLLESFSKSKTASSIGKLGSLKSTEATLCESTETDEYGKETNIELKLLEIGDTIKIRSGESPALDCIIVKGESLFDESALTGESKPVRHGAGEQIFAGTVNVGGGTIIAKVSTIDGMSLLDQIVNTVRDGQLNRAPIERLADVLTGYFVPFITAIAISTWVIWLALGYTGSLPPHYLDIDVGGWVVWSLEFAISVFVVACPCGIGLAAPTALFVGSGLAAKYGILTRGGGAAFQEGSNVSVVCFDKTGTLTLGGDPKVTNYAVHSNTAVRQIAFQVTKDLEMNSRHPLAVGVKNFIDKLESEGRIELSTVKVHESEEVAGKGLKGKITDTNEGIWATHKPTDVILGNETFMKENNCHLNSDQIKMLTDWKLQGKSIILVGIKCPSIFRTDAFQPVLMMAARDEIRPEAKSVIKNLKHLGVECWMISGDNELTARSIAKEVGIENIVAEVLPDEKADKIKWIKSTRTVKGKAPIVAMVGDGINDAPALATADVGVALASGSDMALTSSDFVLLSPAHPLISLLTLLSLSKVVFRRVRFNFAWALIYNMIGVPVAAGVIYPYHNSRLDPVWASAAMAASSVSVVLSSLALHFFRPPKVVTEESQFREVDAVEQPL